MVDIDGARHAVGGEVRVHRGEGQRAVVLAGVDFHTQVVARAEGVFLLDGERQRQLLGAGETGPQLQAAGGLFGDIDVQVDLVGRAPAIAEQLKGFTGREASNDAVVAFMGVEPAYLDAAIDAITERYGSIDGYVEQGLGVDAALRDRIAERLAA